MSAEQLRILKMIEERKISAEDGAKLLNALNAANAARVQAATASAQAQNRWNPGGWAWGGPTPPMPPTPPMAPMPPMPPMPPDMPGFGFDPFDAAFGKGREHERDARNREREARLREREARQREQESRRRRRDTEALDSETVTATGNGARYLRIRVTEAGAKHATVNVNLPISLVNFGLKLAGRYIPASSGIEMQAISEAIQSGALGKIIDVQESGDDERPGTRVEISVE